MKRTPVALAIILVAVCLMFCACTSGRTDFDTARLEAKTTTIVENLLAGDYQAVTDAFAPELLEQLPAASLQAGWEQMVNPSGDYLGQESLTSNIDGNRCTVAALLRFANNGLLVSVTYDSKEQVIGMWTNYQIIDAPDADANYSEVDITVAGDPTLPLRGKLTLPKDVEKPPVVILVQGSGSSDMNETIYSNAPFRDLAWGLAEQGIASIRYDKRYYTYPDKAVELTNAVTIDDEVLSDVYAAIELAQNDDRVDGEQIFVLGHSLGGMLVPAIAANHPELAGVISMAGTLRPLYEVSYDQSMEAAETLRPTLSEQELAILEAQLAQIEADMQVLRDLPTNPTLDPDTTLLGIPAIYWYSLEQYEGEKYLPQISMPMLILQGEDDFQVYADVDYPLWQEKLADRDNVVFHLYTGLNHLMMPTQNKRDVSEYQVKSSVDQKVIDDIAAFINNN